MLRRLMSRGRAFVALVVVVIVVVASPAFADGGLRVEGDSTYDVAPTRGRVTLSSTIVMTNVTVDKIVGSSIQRAYFNAYAVPVSASARNVTAVSNGASLPVTLSPINSLVQRATIGFPNLFSGERRTITFTYEIGSEAARSAGLSRINAAYASFVAFAYGDDSLASVRVNIPPLFTTETIGSAIKSTSSANGTTTLSASAITGVASWGVIVSTRNDSALNSIDADTNSHLISVRSWPGDIDWQRFTVSGVHDGLPVLEKLIGQPWPITSRLLITEASSPYLRGYAGWFLSQNNTIEVGEQLDLETLLHEMSHAWFNRNLFSERWMSEGFAEEYAAQAMMVLRKPATEPALETSNDYAVRLSAWDNPTSTSEAAIRTELYGYHTSAWVIRQLSDEIGLDGMSKVLDAVAHNVPSYGGSADELGPLKTDSHRLLDLLENVGASKKAVDLFKQYVARDTETATYAVRASTRTDYDQLVARSDGWAVPAGIRKSMGDWSFTTAETRIHDATTVLDERDQIRAAAHSADVTPPDQLRIAYEKSADDFTAATTTAERELDAANQLANTQKRLDQGRSITEKIGSLFAHPARRLEQARRAFEDDDTAQAVALAAASRRELDHASTLGIERVIGVAVALVVLVLVVVAVTRVRARRARRRGEEVPLQGPPLDGAIENPAVTDSDDTPADAMP